MPFLASENISKAALVDEARAILDRQETETWAWRDADLLLFLQNGIAALERERPASGYIGVRRAPRTPVEIPPEPLEADFEDSASGSYADALAAWVASIDSLLAEPVLVDWRWHQALVEYICYEAFRRDESDAASQRLAAQHYQSFLELAQK